MLKRQVDIGGEFAWRDRNSLSLNEYRKVTLLEFLDKPGGRCQGRLKSRPPATRMASSRRTWTVSSRL
jgi:hypothetical protein